MFFSGSRKPESMGNLVTMACRMQKISHLHNMLQVRPAARTPVTDVFGQSMHCTFSTAVNRSPSVCARAWGPGTFPGGDDAVEGPLLAPARSPPAVSHNSICWCPNTGQKDPRAFAQLPYPRNNLPRLCRLLRGQPSCTCPDSFYSKLPSPPISL